MPLPRSLLARDEPADHDLAVRAGTWPADLGGELVISAPHPDTFDGPHAFFGDGMTYRLSLEPGTHGAAPGTFAWRQRRIDTPSARLRRKRPDVFTATMLGLHSPFGLTNAANTAPLPWGDRLFMTWDVGRPVEIDPVTMQFLGEVGHRSEWLSLELFPQPLLPMVTSTAHPLIDPDRNVLWTVNTNMGALHVVRWDGTNALQRWPIAGAVMPQSVHTITQTRDWLVVADCAFKVEPQVLFGGERTEPANRSGPVYLIRKDVLEATRPGDEVPCHVFELAPEMNHYYANYDDRDGVQVLFEHTENADIAMAQGAGDTDALGRPCDPALAGLYGFPMSPDRTSVVTFDPATGATTQRAELRDPERLWTRQLSAMDWSREGRTHPTAHHMVYQGWRPEAITQKMLALYKDRVDRTLWPAQETPPLVVSVAMPDLQPTSHHEYALDDFPSSPIFVPRDPGADETKSRHAGSQPGGHDGYVVVPVLNDGGFRVDVFDAGNVGNGPVASLGNANMTVPFILHSAWTPRVATAPALERNRFSNELDRVGELPDDLAAVAHEVARELDEGVPLT
ncbi:MAG TPA: carotenoid oxygenase family protein [Acidimicrobiia bacterium]|nr:carotenoid oxygenase family protein [Acidimicrobiia bacterium]